MCGLLAMLPGFWRDPENVESWKKVSGESLSLHDSVGEWLEATKGLSPEDQIRLLEAQDRDSEFRAFRHIRPRSDSDSDLYVHAATYFKLWSRFIRRWKREQGRAFRQV